MTISSLPGQIRLFEVFRDLAKWHRPPSGVSAQTTEPRHRERHLAWEEESVALLVEALEAIEGSTITLVHDTQGVSHVRPAALRHIHPSWAREGRFFVFDERLNSMEKFDMATMYLQSDIAKSVRARLSKKISPGRQPHPAKSWYADRNYDRQGLPIGKLQAAMKEATGVEPPTYRTIRTWELEAQRERDET